MQAGAFVAGCVVVIIFGLMLKWTFNVDKISSQIVNQKNLLDAQKITIDDISVFGTVANYLVHGIGFVAGLVIMWQAANDGM